MWLRSGGDKLDECRRRTQQETTGRRRQRHDPLYRARRLIRTGAGLLTDKGWERLERLFADTRHAAVETTWSVYQRIVAVYRAKDPAEGRTLMDKVIETLKEGVPEALTELRALGRTLCERRSDILAYFDHPHTSNGPTQATGGRPGHPRGIGLGLAQPHPLHRPQSPARRGIQKPAPTPSNLKSRKGSLNKLQDLPKIKLLKLGTTSRSSLGDPSARITPFLTNSTESVRIIDSTRCVITNKILQRSFTASMIFISVRTSTLDVASSNRIKSGEWTSALAITNLCSWPPDSPVPRSPKGVYTPIGIRLISSHRQAATNASVTSSSFK